MKTGPLLAAVLLASCVILQAATPAGWSTNLAETLQTARQNKQPVLIDFSATWCGPCQMMVRTTFQDETVIETLRHYANLSIDIDANPDLAANNQIRAVPTFLILSSDGDEIVRESGYMNAERFVGWLTNGLSAYEAFQQSRQRFLADQKSIDATLAGSDVAARLSAVKKLFALVGQRDQARQRYAVAQLKSLVISKPAIVLDGLNDSRLATRIQVANLLHEKFGDSFAIDPWTDAAARTREVAAWKSRLLTPEVKAQP